MRMISKKQKNNYAAAMNTVYTTDSRYMCNKIPFCIIYHNDCSEMVEGTTEKDFRAPCRN